mmetsp:Transcript_76880/g.128146  ORF Transcript_76880/g.128146 Transcript_76880/m.128146 type:complete len:106 (-) Transcript_76880:134-451(-)
MCKFAAATPQAVLQKKSWRFGLILMVVVDQQQEAPTGRFPGFKTCFAHLRFHMGKICAGGTATACMLQCMNFFFSMCMQQKKIVTPPLKCCGPPRRQGLCSHQAH